MDLFRDSIAEETYDAELAGLQFSLDYAGDSLTVGTVGYNDKLPALTEKMLGLMRTFKVDETRFGLIKDQVRGPVCSHSKRLADLYTCYVQCAAPTSMAECEHGGAISFGYILRPLCRSRCNVDLEGKG